MGLSECVCILAVCGLLLEGALTREVDYEYGDYEATATPDFDNYNDEYSESNTDSTTSVAEEPFDYSVGPCPPGISYISHSDIRAAIHELSSEFEQEYITKVLPSYEQMRDTFNEELENFKTFIRNQPTRLKSVLENISRQREGLAPDMDHLVNALRGYSIYKKQFEVLLEEKAYIMKNHELYRHNYEDHCEEYESRARSITNIANRQQDGYTCISMQDLFRNIKEQLSQSEENFNQMENVKYQNIEKYYRQKIDDVKNKLKDNAMKVFGEPMFDVLSLQDALYQLTHNVEMENIEAILYEIGTNILNIGMELSVLNRKVKNYGIRSKSKSNRRVLHNGHKCSISIQSTETGYNKIQIIDELVQEKFHDLEESVSAGYEHILKELDAAINEAETEGVFTGTPYETGDEIRELIKTEQQAFGQIQRRVPDNVFKNFNSLLQKTRESLRVHL